MCDSHRKKEKKNACACSSHKGYAFRRKCNTHTQNAFNLSPVCTVYQLLSEKCSIHYASLLAIFNLLHSSTNQELFEKHLCYPNSHYEKYGHFPLRREAIM